MCGYCWHDSKRITNQTHHDGVQVIDEILVQEQYSRSTDERAKVVDDLGAYIGVYSIMYALKTQQRVLVVAVEPVGVNFRLLLANIRVNKLENTVIPLKAAISTRRGIVRVE